MQNEVKKFNHKERHFRLAIENRKVVCLHCEKVVEERDSIPDYWRFMGTVWAKQNLPCKPRKGQS